MYYQRDWLMRQIERMVDSLSLLIFGKKANYEEIYKEKNPWADAIKDLLEKGELCQAEDILFEGLKQKDPQAFQAGLYFYQYIDTFTDEKLEEADFSRREIYQGLSDLARLYGIKEDRP